MVELLPHQFGVTLLDTEEALTTKPYFMNNTNSHDHNREVFHIQDANEYDEEEANIFSEKNSMVGETDEHKPTRWRKNRQRAQWWLHT